LDHNNNEGIMKKRNPALAAALAVPLIIGPAVLATRHGQQKIFGMSPDFVSGFIVGIGIVLLAIAIAQMTKKPNA
jgi:tetrahydromethanopterin S-methyltransferase subunit B